MDFWELAYGGTRKSFADWHLANPHQSERNLDACQMTLTHLSEFDGPEIYAYDSIVTIWRNGVRYFQGRVTDPNRRGNADAESVDYLLLDPWADLEDITFIQVFAIAGGTGQKSRVILNQGPDGASQKCSDQMKEVLQFAIDNGANLQIGTIDGDIYAPLDERSAICCAEAIRLTARWNPDGKTYIDHKTVPPTLHFRLRSNMSPLTLTYGAQAKPLTDLGLQPCYRLQRPAFIIKYEVTVTIDGTEQKNIVEDVAPIGYSGTLRKVPICTIPLRGSNTNTTSQKIKVRDIKDSTGGADSPETIAYWRKIIPALSQKDASGTLPAFTFEFMPGSTSKFSRFLADPEGEDGDGPYVLDKNGDKERLKEDLANELVEGQIADWMPSSIKAQYQLLRANIRVGSNDAVIFTVRLLATNATSRTYRSSETQSGQPVPEGIAQRLYDASSRLEYAGSLVMVEEEVGGSVKMNNVINLAGGLSAWRSMGAVIQGIDRDFETGTTTITLGPPSHLGAQDLITLLNVTRPGHSGQVGELGQGEKRNSATPDDTNTTTLPTKPPAQNTSFLPANGTPNHPYRGFDASLDITPRVKIQLGSHNDIIPLLNGTEMDMDLEMNILILGESDRMVYVQLDIDESGYPTGASIHSAPGDSPPESSDSTAYQVLFWTEISSDGDGKPHVTISENVSGAQWYQFCGGSHLFGLV